MHLARRETTCAFVPGNYPYTGDGGMHAQEDLAAVHTYRIQCGVDALIILLRKRSILRALPIPHHGIAARCCIDESQA
jgi:hypothetical protein